MKKPKRAIKTENSKYKVILNFIGYAKDEALPGLVYGYFDTYQEALDAADGCKNCQILGMGIIERLDE